MTDYIEDVKHLLWRENFEDLPEKIKAYLSAAIENKYGNIHLKCDVYPDEFESAVDTILTDFQQLLIDNLDELENTVQDYFDSLADIEVDEQEEMWVDEPEGDVDIGLDRL